MLSKRCILWLIEASMKVPARRWGNYRSSFKHFPFQQNLNESSRPKAGKFSPPNRMVDYSVTLMKVPDRRRGNVGVASAGVAFGVTSMKVPARRQGNKSIPKQPFRHSNTIDKPKHHASDTPRLRHGQVLAETDKASKGHYPHLYYQSAIELVIPPLPCRASLANEQHAARE